MPPKCRLSFAGVGALSLGESDTVRHTLNKASSETAGALLFGSTEKSIWGLALGTNTIALLHPDGNWDTQMVNGG
jgi:hypothetical protein